MSQATDLAKECGILAYERFKEADVETFFRRAQAMALRDAAKDLDYHESEWLIRMADKLDPPK